MADYYENKFEHDLGEEFSEPIAFSDMSNVTPENIISNMEKICKENDIPALIRESSLEISNGFGIFKKAVLKAVEISHPNPPQSYCKQLYVICKEGIRFFFVGSSKAFSERNNFEAAMNDTGGNLKAKARAFFGIAPDEKPFEQEMEWHNTIHAVFISLLE